MTGADSRRTDPRPPDAWWSAEDNEWVHGARDGQGRLTGRVRYWTEGGAFISECEHVAGRPHGLARRYSPATGALEQECRYVNGRIDGIRVMHRPGPDEPEPEPTTGYGSGGPWGRPPTRRWSTSVSTSTVT